MPQGETVVIKLETWEQFDEWMDRLMARGSKHTPEDLAKVAGEMNCLTKQEGK